MKCLIVVLAVASLCLAEPEADPGIWYGSPYGLYGGYYGYPFLYPRAASGYGYSLPGGYVQEDRLHKRDADPQLLLPHPHLVPLAVPVAHVAPALHIAAPGVATADTTLGRALVLPNRLYTPHDCVTAGGCAARTLKEHGLAKREADAEPGFFYSNPYLYGLPAHPYPYNGFFAPVPVPVRPAVVSPVVAEVNKPVTYTHLGAHPVNPTTVVEKSASVIGHVFTK